MQVRRLFDFIYYQQENCPHPQAFGYRHEGTWTYFSTDEIVGMVNRLSLGLLERGLQAGDKVGLVTYRNRPEWIVVDLALLQLGLINVPVYPTISPSEYEYIFNDAEIKLCFCGADDLVEKVRTAQKNVPSLQEIFAFDTGYDAPLWKELFRDGPIDAVRARMDDVQPSDLATLIYTSGTTGNPKGVMLSHENIVSNILAVQKVIPIKANDRILSFLPLCHIFERAASYAFMYNGVSVSFTGTDNLGGEEGDLQAIRPHFFTSVPRLLEKVYEKIYNKGLELSGPKRALFFWALRLTEDFDFQKKHTGWAALQRRIADKLIFSKWRAALGGEVRGILTGAAPCPRKMIQVFSAAGIPIREAYGLTEASPGLTFNRYPPGEAFLGTVGSALEGVELRIDNSEGFYDEGEGEILAAGPNIMMGYYHKPAETAEAIVVEDGKRWLRTGDVGRLVDGPGGLQYLQITDRKKELLKTSGGKYVAPSHIENTLKEDFLIEQVMVVGEQRKFVSALIVPAEEALREWCEYKEIGWSGLAQAVNDPQVIDKYKRIVDRFNPRFNKVEQIKKFTLIPHEWTPTKPQGDEAELTPTMKLKRRVILRKYAEQIEELYQ